MIVRVQYWDGRYIMAEKARTMSFFMLFFTSQQGSGPYTQVDWSTS